MRCGKKQCYLESLWTFRYNKDIASEKTLKSGEKKGVTMDIIAKISREFDTLKSKKVPQSLEIGLFFCQIFIFII